jgi:hypothetical protein
VKHCVEANQDRIRQAEAEQEKVVDSPALDPATHELLQHCNIIAAADRSPSRQLTDL